VSCCSFPVRRRNQPLRGDAVPVTPLRDVWNRSLSSIDFESELSRHDGMAFSYITSQCAKTYKIGSLQALKTVGRV
jgi:hypothetical protein